MASLRGRLTFTWILLSVQEVPVCSEPQSVEASMATVRFMGTVGAGQVHTIKKKSQITPVRGSERPNFACFARATCELRCTVYVLMIPKAQPAFTEKPENLTP